MTRLIPDLKFLSLPLAILAMGISLVACDSGNSPEEAKAYNEMIAPRHDTLARALILQGRMIENINISPDIIEKDDFYNAEDLLNGWIDELGSEAVLEAIELPGNSSQVADLHETFITSVANLRQASKTLEDGLYTKAATPAAEKYWSAARKNFMTFTRQLNEAVGGEPLPEVKEEEEPEGPKVGDYMKIPEEEPM